MAHFLTRYSMTQAGLYGREYFWEVRTALFTVNITDYVIRDGREDLGRDSKGTTTVLVLDLVRASRDESILEAF